MSGHMNGHAFGHGPAEQPAAEQPAAAPPVTVGDPEARLTMTRAGMLAQIEQRKKARAQLLAFAERELGAIVLLQGMLNDLDQAERRVAAAQGVPAAAPTIADEPTTEADDPLGR